MIDTGEEVKTICVGFDAAGITGEDLLRRADVDAVLWESSSMGAAVCSLCGTGCPAEDCFCERDAYWNYSHAEDGEWVRASRGASSRTLTDGDVDGWAWGNGVTPPYRSFAEVCPAGASASPSPTPAEQPGSPSPAGPSPAATPTAASPSASPAPTPTGSPTTARTPGPGGGSTASGTAPTGSPIPPPTPDASLAPSAPTADGTAGGTVGETPGETPEAATAPGDGGDAGSLVLFGVVAAVLAGAIWWRRRR